MFCRSRVIQINSVFRLFSSINKKIDFSKLPKLMEEDLDECFIRGDGPGKFTLKLIRSIDGNDFLL